MRAQHADYDEVEAYATRVAAQNPQLREQILAHPEPAAFTYEVGTKQIMLVGDGEGFISSLSYDAAAYLTNVTNEIVPYRGGRFYFTAGSAQRTGAEIAVTAMAKGGVRFENSLTLSRNEYTDYVVDSVHYGKPGAKADFSGNRIVGIPDWFYGSNLSWSPSQAPLGLSAQFGVQGTGGYWADDANAVRVTESHILSASLRADRLLQVGDATLKAFVAVENLADRRWIGSAFLNPDIVNGRPLAFEPGMPRTVMLSFSVVRGR